MITQGDYFEPIMSNGRKYVNNDEENKKKNKIIEKNTQWNENNELYRAACQKKPVCSHLISVFFSSFRYKVNYTY